MVTFTQKIQAQAIKNCLTVVENFRLQTDSLNSYCFLEINQLCTYPELLSEAKKMGMNLPGEPGLNVLQENSVYEVNFEKLDQETFSINFETLPYYVDRRTLMNDIVSLSQKNKIKGIRKISDGPKTGLIVELCSGVNPKKVLNTIYKKTNLGALLSSQSSKIIALDEKVNLFKGDNGKLYVCYLSEDGQHIYRMSTNEEFERYALILCSKSIAQEDLAVKR